VPECEDGARQGRGATLWIRLAVGLVLVAVAFVVDRPAFGVLRSSILYDHWGELREGLTAAKFLGSGLGTALIAGVVGVVDPRGRRRAAVLLLVAIAAGLAAGLLKIGVGRERPSHFDQPVGAERIVFRGPEMGLGEAAYQSFPSGHVTAAFASATCLASFYPPARVICFGVATAAGVNRVVKHQHFLSDVVAGGLLGHLMALLLLHRTPLRHWWRAEIVDREGGRP
jgi:membrane-associated phospholipid phosphatase